MRDQQLQGRRPRFSIYDCVIKEKNLETQMKKKKLRLILQLKLRKLTGRILTKVIQDTGTLMISKIIKF